MLLVAGTALSQSDLMKKWYKDALCIGMHSDMFYPPLKEDRIFPEAAYYRLGKLVCEHCPIKEECLRQGASEDFGLWGGRTPKERHLNTYSPPKSLLPPESLHVMPTATDAPLDLREAVASLKPYLKRRTKRFRSI